jgi:hypothetical protein
VYALYSEVLPNLFYPPNIVPLIKLRMMRWAERVASMGVKRYAYRVLVGGNLKVRGQLEDLGVNGVMILELILEKQDERAWIELMQILCFVYRAFYRMHNCTIYWPV